MITAIRSYVQRGRHILYRLQTDTRLHTAVRIAARLLSGFLLSAASLGGHPQPFALGLVCAGYGWSATLMALGGCLGYLLFWGSAGYPGVLWMVAGLGLSWLPGSRQGLLLPLGASLIVAVTGLISIPRC